MDLLKPILSHASRMPNQKALVFGDVTYTYKELNDEINRYSHGFEVEQILNGYPGIVESAIIGLPDPKWGEVVTAVIVKKEDVDIDEEEIKAYCREHLAGYKLPRHFIYVDALPRNVSGKILKYQLRENWKESKIN